MYSIASTFTTKNNNNNKKTLKRKTNTIKKILVYQGFIWKGGAGGIYIKVFPLL